MEEATQATMKAFMRGRAAAAADFARILRHSAQKPWDFQFNDASLKPDDLTVRALLSTLAERVEGLAKHAAEAAQ